MGCLSLSQRPWAISECITVSVCSSYHFSDTTSWPLATTNWYCLVNGLSYIAVFRQLVAGYDVWMKQVGERIRRNSLTTLHSLPSSSSSAAAASAPSSMQRLTPARHMSVPHGYNVWRTVCHCLPVCFWVQQMHLWCCMWLCYIICLITVHSLLP